jgi:methylenetetrahydrofolate--tRNA-(uracil-5-)-methyltransferase
LKQNPAILFAGQISGVEGYVEAIATGLLAGRNAARLARGLPALAPPPETALGALCRYISGADPRDYQPANITFDLLPPLPEDLRRKLAHDRRARHRELCRRAQEVFEQWMQDCERAGTAG